eukprot:CAMPEP_0185192092 /NCGR_PEP_ID=MMETSP1140-20130426/17747_1 /TAXON_ID=298111 /ORGANISM="Pavlova sp., Strain CCMP459" /LENGTH=94 /DNA_ID=CAMNT_0027758821 /DNA_START=8 /DNA_END=288 /DNA_ORIENTATION=-
MTNIMTQFPKRQEPKVGPFVQWTEDAESVEMKLPIPPGLTKHDLKAVFTPVSLSITTRAEGKELLAVKPLAARIVSDETTWYLNKDIMTITLAR